MESQGTPNKQTNLENEEDGGLILPLKKLP
jgi:hypothetical protein